MKITYKFANGESNEVQVDEELGSALLIMDKTERNSDHRETRRHVSLDDMEYEGEIFMDHSSDTHTHIERKETTESLLNAINSLLPQQKELLHKVFFEGMSITEIARADGVSKQSVHERLNRILTKLKSMMG